MSFFHKLLEVKKCSKGNGIFAIDNIPINTIIIKEIPLIYDNLNKTNYKDYLNESSLEQYGKLLLTILQSENKTKFLNLVPIEYDEYIINYSKIQNIHTKYFSDIDPKVFCLYYSKILRNAFYFHNNIPSILFFGTLLNHSCEPNVLFYPKKEYIIFKTCKFIKKNDEILALYINEDSVKKMNTLTRKNYLLKNYGFNCDCIKCK